MMTSILTFALRTRFKTRSQRPAVLSSDRIIQLASKTRAVKVFAVSLTCINILSVGENAFAAETLEQVWAIALQRDHTLVASQQKELAANHQLLSAQANYLPRMTLESGYLRTESEPAAKINIPALPMLRGVSLPFAQEAASFGALSMTAPMYTSGKIASGVAAAQAQLEAMQAHTQLTRSDLKLAIAQSYIAVLRAGHAVAVSNSHMAAVSKHVADVQALFEKGYVAKHDLLASQVALADAQQLNLQAGNALELAKAALNRWLGRTYEQTVEIVDIGAVTKPETQALPDLTVLQQQANGQRKELKELEQLGLAYKKQAASVAAGHLPQIGINAGYGKLENRYLLEDKGWWVGLVVKWELFDGGVIRHQASQLSASAQAVGEMELDAREKIALQIRQSWLTQKEAQARMQLVGKAVEQAEETLTLARERYRSGLAPNSDVLDAEARRLQAYSNRDNAIYDFEFARLQLLHASGQL